MRPLLISLILSYFEAKSENCQDMILLPERKKMVERNSEKTFPTPPETHLGIVIWMEEDFCTVRLQNPQGQIYERDFETPFLQSIGIELGDSLRIVFEGKIEGKEAVVTMRVSKQEPVAETQPDDQESFNPWNDERLNSMLPH